MELRYLSDDLKLKIKEKRDTLLESIFSRLLNQLNKITEKYQNHVSDVKNIIRIVEKLSKSLLCSKSLMPYKDHFDELTEVHNKFKDLETKIELTNENEQKKALCLEKLADFHCLISNHLKKQANLLNTLCVELFDNWKIESPATVSEQLKLLVKY